MRRCTNTGCDAGGRRVSIGSRYRQVKTVPGLPRVGVP